MPARPAVSTSKWGNPATRRTWRTSSRASAARLSRWPSTTTSVYRCPQPGRPSSLHADTPRSSSSPALHAADAARPERNRTSGRRPGRRPRAARLLAALGDRLVDAFAVRAYREPRRIPVGHPLLPAQRDHRSAAHRTVHDLVLQDVVGEPLVIAVTSGKVWPDLAVLAGFLLGKHFGTHGT